MGWSAQMYDFGPRYFIGMMDPATCSWNYFLVNIPLDSGLESVENRKNQALVEVLSDWWHGKVWLRRVCVVALGRYACVWKCMD